MATVSVTDENFDNEVLKSSKPIVVDFWAEWCGPCKVLKPIMEEISNEMSDKLNFFYMDIDESPSTPTLFSIRGVPTLIQFDEKGEQKGIKVGATSKSNVISFINDNI